MAGVERKSFVWFCAKCGVREVVEGIRHAQSKATVHNKEVHRGTNLAFYEVNKK